jgi:Ca2+-transporting ATPase
MAGLFGFIMAFLGSAAFGVTLILFNPLQILFVNFLIQAPIAASLAFDTPTPGLMNREPRQADEKIFSTSMMIRLLIVGAVAALFTIIAYQWTISTTGSTETAQTMAMVIFSLTHIPFTLGLRHPFNVVFRAETLSNRYLLLACSWVILIVILVTELRLLQGVFGTVALAPQLWGVCLIVVVGFLLSSEVIKLILKLTTNRFQ